MENLPGRKVTLMLADSAQAIGGKLYILGADGSSQRRPCHRWRERSLKRRTPLL